MEYRFTMTRRLISVAVFLLALLLLLFFLLGLHLGREWGSPGAKSGSGSIALPAVTVPTVNVSRQLPGVGSAQFQVKPPDPSRPPDKQGAP